MLNRDYVENKLRTAATGQAHPGSDVQPLIDRCDWSNLATALTNDRDLALKLFEEQPFNTNIFDANTYQRILRSIDEMKGKYFAELSDSSTFTINTHSREISARQTSNYTNHESSPTPLAIAPSDTRHYSRDPPSKKSFTWKNVYNAIASGLGGTQSSPKSRASPPSSDTDWDNETSYSTLLLYSRLQNRFRPISPKKFLSTDHISHFLAPTPSVFFMFPY